MHFLKNNFQFEGTVDVNNCLQQIKIPNLLHALAVSTVSKVPLGRGGGAEVLVVCTVGHETLIQNVSQNMMRTCKI